MQVERCLSIQSVGYKDFYTSSVCELSYRYFVKYENIGTEWKQMLEDSGITEDLQLGRENVSGLKGKWSKRFSTTSRIFLFYYYLYY